MPNTETPAGPAGGPVALPDLPEKLRVHALARLVGRTSKEVLAALADLGTEVRSAQSSVDRATAEKVAAVLAPAPEAPAAPAQDTAPAAEQPAAEEAPPAPRTRRRRTRASAAPETAPEAVDATPAEAAPAESPVVESPVADAPVDAPAAEPTLRAPAPRALAPVFAPPAPLFQPPARPSRARRRAAEPVVDEVEVEEPAELVAEDDVAVDELVEDQVGPDADDADDESGRRRRRRGRRGRGRGKGGEDENGEADTDEPGDDDTVAAPADGTTDDTTDDTTAEDVDDARADRPADEADDDESGDDDESRPTGSRRRRRRRRRGGAGDDETGDNGQGAREDDPPITVTRVRAPRERAADEAGDGVQGVRGSTRLEAKRQRRRDGRDAGRRRTPILSESEFLARREAVERTMVVRERGDRVEIGVLEDDVLVEHFIAGSVDGPGREGQTAKSLVGNIYLGRVQNVLPSMEAAFVDIGRGRNAVLYAGEVDWDAAGLGGKARRIEQALSSGDSVLVQVTKDPIGHKGARLTTQISLAGRFLVYVPSGGAAGISRKLPDVERKRLKDLLRDIVPPEAGVIIRTASEGVSHEALERDVRRLQAQWEVVEAKAKATGPSKPKAPVLLYEEPDLLIKVVRDQFNEDFSKLVVQGDDAWDVLHGYLSHVAPELADRTHRHVGPTDVFAEYRIDEQLLKALDRKVWLPSGGTLVIDRTEAMTVVDVNTGKYTGSGGNLEETVTRNNLEAAEEVVRQLRLRDIGGIIVVDFIDMVLESNRDLVLKRLTECLARDRTRHQVAEVTSLGLVQMTRKRVGGGLLEHFSTPCEHCRGRGVVVEVEAPADTGREGRRGRSGRARRGENGHAGGPAEVAAAAAGRNGRAPAHDPGLDVGAPAAEPAPVAATEPGLDAAADAVEEAVVERELAAATTPAPPVAEAPAAVSPAEVPALPDADDHGHQARPARRRGRVTRGAGAPTATAGEAPAAVVLTVPAGTAVVLPAEAQVVAAPAAATPPVETPLETPVETAPVETAPVQAPVDAAPVEAPPAAPAAPAPDGPPAPRPRRARRTASRPAGPPPSADTPV
jgi:ribonuclease E